ncbi:hypothetical protein [Streptomyces ziwulingensis]
MSHREPDAARPDEFAGPSGGQAVWESELPWQLAAPDEAGTAEPAPAAADETTDRRLAAWVPEEPGAHALHTGRTAGHGLDMTPAAGHGTDITPAADPAPAAAPAGRRTRGHDGHSTGGGRRAAARASLVKPVLAGAGVLSALFLLVPSWFDENAPAQTVQAGAEDVDPDHTPDEPDPSTSASPRPGTTGAAKDSGRAGDKGDRIAEVAATAPTQEARLVAAVSESGTPTRTATAKPSRASATPKPAATTQQPDWTTTVLHGTSVLEAGQSWSTNRVDLIFQGDGNLVLYDKKGTPLWWSGTAGQGAKAVFQADGNLAVYTGDGQTAWSSRTDGHDGAELVLRADGNVVVQQGGTVLWSTGTAM